MKWYRLSVYFAHGITAWQGKLDERDVVYSIDVPWLWLACWLAAANLGNRGQLLYVIHDADTIVKQSKPELAP